MCLFVSVMIQALSVLFEFSFDYISLVLFIFLKILRTCARKKNALQSLAGCHSVARRVVLLHIL